MIESHDSSASNASKIATEGTSSPPEADALRRTREGHGSRPKPRFGIRLLVTIVGVGVTVLAVLAVGASQERDTRKALTSELEARVLLEARNLALTSSRALLDEFPELTLQPLIKEKQRRQPELEILVVTDQDGAILGHPEQHRLGETFQSVPDAMAHETQRRLLAGESMTANPRLLIASSPVEYQGQSVGQVSVGIQRSYIDQVLSEARKRQLMILCVVLLLAAALGYGTMTKLLRPIDALRSGVERIGQGDLDSPIEVEKTTELGLLAESVNEMAADLKRAQAEMVEKERLAHELELAREIQSGLLPKQRQETGNFLIDGAHEAAFEVGGDYYDFFELPDGRVGIAVADVAGKGLAGCLVTSMLSALLGAFRDQYDSPSELLTKLDERLVQDFMSGSFVTMFYGILDPAAGRMCFASAGHMPTLIFRKETGAVEEYRTRGIPLGAVKGGVIRRTLHDEWVDLADGDLLLQYTDGINETLDPEGVEQFDLPRMHSIVSGTAESGAATVMSKLIEAIADWRAGTARLDDETIVVVSRELAASQPALPASTTLSGGGDAEVHGDQEADDPNRVVGSAEIQNAEVKSAEVPSAEVPSAEVASEGLGAVEVKSAETQSTETQSARLQGAGLQGSDLRGAEMRSTGLQGSDLQGAEMRSTELQNADLRGAEMRSTELQNADLRGAEMPSPGLKNAEEIEAIQWLSDAQRRGVRLDLRSDLDGLASIREWLDSQAWVQSLEKDKKEVLWTAIYEACANIAEHGYGAMDAARFYLWWIPDFGKPDLKLIDGSQGSGESKPDDLATAEPSSGRFLLLDGGRPFSGDDWTETDFTDPKVWRQYRGFGLDIIHRVMTRVVYRPGTRHGNVTLLCFDPDHLEKEELSNVRGL